MRAHGSHAKYAVERCRCDPCRAAQRTYNRNRLRRHLGLHPTRARDGFDEWQADELATRLGLHPEQVWGDAWVAEAVG